MNRARAPHWVVIALLAACGGTPPAEDASSAPADAAAPPLQVAAAPPPAAAMPPAQKLDLEAAVKAHVTASTAAWSAKDVKKNTALYTADAKVGVPGPKGWEEAKPAEMEKSLADWFAAFPDIELTTTRVVARGDVALTEWVVTGTHKGELMGKKPTGKKIGYRGASILTFAPDGKVKKESVYFNLGTMMGQLGLGDPGQKVRPVEAKPAAPTAFLFAKEGDPSGEATAKTWLQTAEKVDTKALLALASDDLVVSNQYMPSDTKGKKALEKELVEGGKAFVDQKTNIASCVATADVVACEYAWTATWKGPAMGMKPTGKTGTVHSLEVIDLKAGKVTRTTAYANGAEFASTFGLMDEPAAPPPAKPPAQVAPKKK